MAKEFVEGDRVHCAGEGAGTVVEFSPNEDEMTVQWDGREAPRPADVSDVVALELGEQLEKFKAEARECTARIHEMYGRYEARVKSKRAQVEALREELGLKVLLAANDQGGMPWGEIPEMLRCIEDADRLEATTPAVQQVRKRYEARLVQVEEKIRRSRKRGALIEKIWDSIPDWLRETRNDNASGR